MPCEHPTALRMLLTATCAMLAAACSAGGTGEPAASQFIPPTSTLRSGNDAAQTDTVEIGGGVLLSTSVADALDASATEVEQLVPTGLNLPLASTGATYEISVTGQPDGPVQVWIPAPPLTDDDIPLVAVADGPDAPWELLYTERSPNGQYLIAVTDHFSLFSTVTALVSDVVDLASELFDTFTGDVFAEAEQPTCGNEIEAWDVYDVGWVGDDTIKWCIGLENDHLIARVVNARRYALVASLRHMTFESGGGSLTDIVAQRMAFGGAALAPREEVQFALTPQPDSNALLITEFDGVADALYQLQYGVDLALMFLTRGGSNTALTAAEFTGALLDSDKCREVTETSSIGADNIIRSCFTPEILAEHFGTAGAFVAVFMLSGGLVDFFRSRANAMGDIFSGRDEYRLIVAVREADNGLPGGDPDATPVDRLADDPVETVRRWSAALIAGNQAEALDLEVQGREPTVYEWADGYLGGDTGSIWDSPRCWDDGPDRQRCAWIRADPSPDLVLEKIDGRWLVSYPFSSPTFEVSLGDACVTDTTPLNLRGGVGLQWPAFSAIPVGDCTVEIFDEVYNASNGRPWRAVVWSGLAGWVSDLYLEPTSSSQSGPSRTTPPVTVNLGPPECRAVAPVGAEIPPSIDAVSSGHIVQLMQEFLIDIGYGAAIKASGGSDGQFGPGTSRAVNDYLRDSGDDLGGYVFPLGEDEWLLTADGLRLMGVRCG